MNNLPGCPLTVQSCLISLHNLPTTICKSAQCLRLTKRRLFSATLWPVRFGSACPDGVFTCWHNACLYHRLLESRVCAEESMATLIESDNVTFHEVLDEVLAALDASRVTYVLM